MRHKTKESLSTQLGLIFFIVHILDFDFDCDLDTDTDTE